jgi:hypothetical protein
MNVFHKSLLSAFLVVACLFAGAIAFSGCANSKEGSSAVTESTPKFHIKWVTVEGTIREAKVNEYHTYGGFISFVDPATGKNITIGAGTRIEIRSND